MPEAIQELAQNKDYYGGTIYAPEFGDRRLPAYGDFLINQATPFSLRAWNRLHGEGAPMLDQEMAFWGFQPAPASITNPERGEKFQIEQEKKGYRARMKEPARVNILNAPPGP